MNIDSLFWKVVKGELPLPNAATLLGWKFVKHDEYKNKVHIEFDASTSLTNPIGNIQGGHAVSHAGRLYGTCRVRQFICNPNRRDDRGENPLLPPCRAGTHFWMGPD